MAQPTDPVTVHDAAVNLDASGTTITVPHLAAALGGQGIDCDEAELRAIVSDLETRRYLGFTGQWDDDEKIYKSI